MIEAKDVSLLYKDGTTGLHPFNLNVSKGQLLYITGPSGSGKTSLLKLFMGIQFPTDGRLSVLGCSMKENNTKSIEKLRQSIGPVFQEFRLIEGRTVLDNVILGMRFLDFKPKEIKENALEAIERVGLIDKVNGKVENLSFGETQRVAIARAVARKPALILADEPTGNLDVDNALNILELLTSFRDENTAVVLTTHATHLMTEKENSFWLKMDEGKFNIERFGH